MEGDEVRRGPRLFVACCEQVNKNENEHIKKGRC